MIVEASAECVAIDIKQWNEGHCERSHRGHINGETRKSSESCHHSAPPSHPTQNGCSSSFVWSGSYFRIAWVLEWQHWDQGERFFLVIFSPFGLLNFNNDSPKTRKRASWNWMGFIPRSSRCQKYFESNVSKYCWMQTITNLTVIYFIHDSFFFCFLDNISRLHYSRVVLSQNGWKWSKKLLQPVTKLLVGFCSIDIFPLACICW